MSPSDLEDKILTLLDGELPPGEVAGLEEILLHDPEARETYRILVQLHNALESRYLEGDAVRQMAVVPQKWRSKERQGRSVRLALFAAAAVVMISVVMLWPDSKPGKPQAIGSVRTTPDSFLVIHPEGPAANDLMDGARLRLVQGMMECEFESGVRLVAEAPCDLRVINRELVALDSGNVWFQVPHAASGFTVRTPEIEIVDLGTEFGVRSSPGEHDEVHVAKGVVEVASRDQAEVRKSLVAGSALKAGVGGGLVEIKPDESLFQTQLVRTRHIAIVNHSFEADVLPRDGKVATKETGKDDYDKDTVPSGWSGFDDGDGGNEGTRGILSTAPDSYFRASLAATPDADANDQMFFSAARDIFQVLPERLQPDTTYVLTVDIGDRATSDEEGFPGNPGIRLGVGSAPDKNLLEAVSTDFPRQVDGGWVTWSVTCRTGPRPPGLGEPLRIELTSGSRVGWFDRVRLTETR